MGAIEVSVEYLTVHVTQRLRAIVVLIPDQRVLAVAVNFRGVRETLLVGVDGGVLRCGPTAFPGTKSFDPGGDGIQYLLLGERDGKG